MDNQCASISQAEAAVLVNDDTVDLAALLQMPEDALNTDDEMTDLSFDWKTSMKSDKDFITDNFCEAEFAMGQNKEQQFIVFP